MGHRCESGTADNGCAPVKRAGKKNNEENRRGGGRGEGDARARAVEREVRPGEKSAAVGHHLLEKPSPPAEGDTCRWGGGEKKKNRRAVPGVYARAHTYTYTYTHVRAHGSPDARNSVWSGGAWHVPDNPETFTGSERCGR